MVACKASLRWNGTWDEIPAEVRLVPYELGGDYDALSLVGGDSVVDSGRRIYLHKFTYFSVVKPLAGGAVQNRHSLYCYRPASTGSPLPAVAAQPVADCANHRF